MGAVKNHAMEMAALYYEEGQLELFEKLLNLELDIVSALGTLPFVRMNMDKNCFFIDRKEPSKLSQKVFIGGEGIEKNELVFCKECLLEFDSFLDLEKVSIDNRELYTSNTLTSLVFEVQNEADSCPVDEPANCLCGNWMWDRIGHDVLLDYVAGGEITADVATAWINRNLSWNLDTRAYNRDFIESAIARWEERWQA